MSLQAYINPGEAGADNCDLEPTQSHPCHPSVQGTFPLLTHTGCAILIRFIAPIASLIGPAPVAPIGVDTHGLVSRAHEWELDAFIGVCKVRGATHQGSMGSVSSLRNCLPTCPVTLLGMSLLLAGPASLLQRPWVAPPVLDLCVLGEFRLGPGSFLCTMLFLDKLFICG